MDVEGGRVHGESVAVSAGSTTAWHVQSSRGCANRIVYYAKSDTSSLCFDMETDLELKQSGSWL